MGTEARYNLQFSLTSKFLEDCSPAHPCDYHRDRATSSLHRLPILCDDEENPTIRTFTAPIGPELRTVCQEIVAADHPPAGSWALVGSQRRWFVRQLRDAYANFDASKISHAIAGVASHVHLIGTMQIIAEALSELPGKTVALTVFDGHEAPLEQIEAMLPLWGGSGGMGRMFKARSIQTSWGKVPIHSTVRDVLTGSSRPDRIAVEIERRSLEDHRGTQQGKFHVISEHFVSSMYWKGGYTDQIRALRDAYRHYLGTDGRLICADGLTDWNDSGEFSAFVAGHLESGFALLPDTVLSVWDIYGHSREDVEAWLDPGRTQTSPIEKGNTLSVFERSS